MSSLQHLISTPVGYVVWIAAVALVILNFILLSVLIIILALRKVMGAIQSRIGPNRVGGPLGIGRRWGLGQTAADALKLFVKEDVIPANADRFLFWLAPILVFIPAFMVYVVMPFGNGLIARDLNVGIVYIAAVTSLGVLGIILGGWASNNKYSLIGTFRSAAHLVSYEVPLVLAMLGPVMLSGSLRLQDIVQAQDKLGWFILPQAGFQLLALIVYLPAAMAEVNLTPFDIVEAESELVAGFNTEYSGMKFALFFLAEFANMFTLSAIATTLFFGGWLAPWPLDALPFMKSPPVSLLWFLGKSTLVLLFLMWVRSTLPRVRIDQLMDLCWKFLLPVALLNIAWTGAYVLLFR
ncbi:MAG: NADH-quinone oxidoreductase subunit NuoH [Armatimonadetes bacterium]|nr:NADH-quinone oxidoreductase subunit NuoH [Armatimonadota bacterium]